MLIYIEFTISFVIGWKLIVNFWNQHLWHHLAVDYTIIMSRTLKVTGNHVMYDRRAWFLRVVLLSSCALCFLLSEKKQNDDFHFFFIQYKGYQLQPSASADNPYLNIDYSGYCKNLIQYLFLITQLSQLRGPVTKINLSDRSVVNISKYWTRHCPQWSSTTTLKDSMIAMWPTIV